MGGGGRGGVVHCNRKFAESYTTIGRLPVQNSLSILSDLGIKHHHEVSGDLCVKIDIVKVGRGVLK